MAGGAEKKLKQRNEEILAWFGKVLIGALAVFVPVRCVYFASSMTWSIIFISVISCAAILISYQQMASAAARGLDLGLEGSVIEYMQDIIYVGAFILVLSVFTNYAFSLWLLVLLFAGVKLWSFALPWLNGLFSGSGEANDEQGGDSKRGAGGRKTMQHRRGNNNTRQ